MKTQQPTTGKRVDTGASLIVSVRVDVRTLAILHGYLSANAPESIKTRGAVCRMSLDLLKDMALKLNYSDMSIAEAVTYVNHHLPVGNPIRKKVVDSLIHEESLRALTETIEEGVSEEELPSSIADRIQTLSHPDDSEHSKKVE
jgi:hypothetical protein